MRFFLPHLKILLPSGAVAVNKLATVESRNQTYDKKTFDGRGIERTGRRLEQVVAQHLEVLGSGGAGFLLRTDAARLAEYVSQPRRRAARGVGSGTACAVAGQFIRLARPRRAA